MSSAITEEDDVAELSLKLATLQALLRRHRSRRQRGILGIVLGLTFFAGAYTIWQLLPPGDRLTLTLTCLAGGTALIAYGIYVKRYPDLQISDRESLFLDLNKHCSQADLELQFQKIRNQRRRTWIATPADHQSSYEDDLEFYVAELRRNSIRSRRANHVTQMTTIIGSLAATGISSLSLSVTALQWISPIITFIVGAASGIAAYFKFRDRGFYSQQTANAIDQEVAAYRLKIRRYKEIDDTERAREMFLEEVHRLRVEQENREQDLDQPVKVKGDGE
ncbi:SLATT domain-containing protein [Amycolatopsis nalaikhensis]|uniref:SLATT domain-containing protein n=1 Tax=Amycolatopsis nalaikhensis TaxID=715472 RepID=A0ABY8XB54_9PSEU|nr:SLATT domain-containing protein [Amycolatopsis sp. 2-2]WIV52583.1 SLATT domain-containing protein [Amycolatopsis sp. 2-2]